MAQTYEQWKKSYESLDDAQKKQYADIAQSKWADYIGSKYLAQYSWGQQAQATSPSVKQASDQRTQEVVNKANQTQSTLNSLSQTAAQYASRNAQVGTGDVAEMPEQPKVSSVQQPTQDKFAKSWNNLSAAQQKAALTKKGMLDYVNSKWLTVKKEETPATTTTKPKQTTYTTPKQQEWDYQDNSQARMDEIARNLNWFRQTNPELFQDPSTFYGFFIDGKGRSQDQIDYLWNYYDRVKKYSKYDNMPASSLWEWLADGSIPKDYLDYIKWVDPQKYQEILSYKQDWEDRIKNESYLDDLSSMAWYESEESDLPDISDPVTYAKKMWYFVDEDGNWVDDNLYVKPTDEERQDVDRINEINARRMEIKNMQKNLLDDLTEKYPWVPKATLMGIVQDRTKDISREYDDLWVELVQLQGTVDYLQNERKMQSEARQQTIENLDTAYWMYYQYSPEWLAELAQAQYWATNITLDQADSWNETQKQMALEAAITPIFQQYWDIIERSPAEVINDTIAYAKKNGVWLRQALQESFMDYLKEKPAYKAMQAAMTNSWWDIKNIYVDWEQQSVWYNPETWETKPIWFSYNSSTGKFDTISMNDWGEWDYQQNRWAVQGAMRDWASSAWNKDAAAQSITANMEWTYLWTSTCGYYVNDYIYGMTWVKWPFGSEIASKRAACTNTWLKWAKVWDAIVFDWNIAWWVNWVYPEYWHVGIITWFNPSDWSLQVSSSIWGKVQTRTIKPWDAWYKNIYGTMSVWYKTKRDENPAWHPMYEAINDVLYDTKNNLTQDQKANLKNAETMYSYLYGMASDWSLAKFVNSSDFQKIMKDVVNQSFSNDDWWDWFASAWAKAVAKAKISDPVVLQVANRFQRLVELKLRKESWAAISSSEWKSNFSNLLPQPWEDASTKQDKLLWWEQGLIYPTFRYSGMPEWYVWLFDTNVWLFPNVWWQWWTAKVWDTYKWSWNITTNKDGGTILPWQPTWVTSKWSRNTASKTWQWTTVNGNDQYSSLYSILWY